MAHKKAGGSTKNLRDSQPKFLGVKLFAGQKAKNGSILVRQRGTKILSGPGTKVGRDHTIYAIRDGVVNYTQKRKIGFDGNTKKLKVAKVI